MNMPRNKIIWGGIGILILVLVVVLLASRSPVSVFGTAVAMRGDLTDIVSVTGRVKANESVDLAFERAGRITGVYGDVGDAKARGSTLVELDGSDIAASLAQARASVNVATAKLNDLKQGPRPEEVDVQTVKVSEANIALGKARTSLMDTLHDAFTKSDDAVRGKVDGMFNDPRSSSPTITFDLSNQQLELSIESGRVNVEQILNEWGTLSFSASSTEGLVASAERVKGYLNNIKTFLGNVALAVNGLTPSAALSQTSIDTYKTNVSTARTNVNTAITNVATAEETLKTSDAALGVAEQQLVLTKAGATTDAIAAAEAEVEAAQASVENYEAQLAKTVLVAPIAGVITTQDAKVGEIATAGKTLVTLMGAGAFKIEANVPEADIAKIKIGDHTDVTLDAYGESVVFSAHVSSIEPAETMIEGVATYKTTFMFDAPDARIKSGMTANIDVLADERKNVIYVPDRTIIHRSDGTSVVRIPTGANTYREVSVTAGLRGSDGNTEITSGLTGGETVILYINQ